MNLPEDALSLRIFIGESDRHGQQPLYEFIVKQARELQMAGATVTRCPMGFGKSSHIHTEKILQLSMDLPIVIEMVDSEEKINGLLPKLEDWLADTGALVTIEKVKVVHYRAGAVAGAAHS